MPFDGARPVKNKPSTTWACEHILVAQIQIYFSSIAAAGVHSSVFLCVALDFRMGRYRRTQSIWLMICGIYALACAPDP
jgi:hypothetical protein